VKKDKFQNLCYAKKLEISYLRAFSTTLSIGLPFGIMSFAHLQPMPFALTISSCQLCWIAI